MSARGGSYVWVSLDVPVRANVGLSSHVLVGQRVRPRFNVNSGQSGILLRALNEAVP